MSARLPRALAALAAGAGIACADVEPAPPQPNGRIPINPASLTLPVGDSAAIGFTVGQGTRIVVTSSAPAIAEPSTTDASATHAVVVRGKAAGGATLTVVFVVGRETTTATVPVTVTARPPTPLAIAITPVARTLGVGDTVRFVATIPASRQGEDVGATFASLDTTVVTIDQSGLATARRVGVATAVVARRSDPNVRAAATVTVVPAGLGDARIRVGPATAVTLAPNASLTIGASLVRGDSVLTRDPRAFAFTSSDSCVAYVSAGGRLSGGRSGEATIAVRSHDVPTQSATVSARVLAPAVLRVTIQSVTTGSPAVPVDLSAVRGTITVRANVEPSLLPGRVEVRLAGRLVESRVLPAPSGAEVVPLAIEVNTAARDQATGAPLHPNGAQVLAVGVATTRAPAVPGCPAELDVQTVPLQLTLANPTPAAGRAP